MTTTIKTRILSRIDLYENWVNNNPTPMEGEVCIVVVPAEAGAIPQEPATLLKVGDGETAFADLPFLTAIAGDVYDWAKASTKPTYAASEITGIDTFIAEYVSEEMGIDIDTDTQYTMVPVEGNAYQYKLMSKSKADSTYTNEIATIDIPKYDDSSLLTRINTLETLVGSETVAAQIATQITALDLANTYEAKGSAAEVQLKLDAEIARASAAEESLISRLVPLETFLEAAEFDTEDSNVIDTLKELQVYIKSDETGTASLLASINRNTAAISAVNSVVTNINNLSGQVSANTSAIAVLNGTGDGSVDAKIDAAFNEFATNVTDDNVVNSYKELINYAAQHGSDFTALVGTVDENTKAIASNAAKISANENSIGTNTQAIQTNAEAIAGLKELVGTTNVADQISSAIAAEKISETYATKADLNTTNNNVATAQSTASEAKTSASQANAAIAALHQVAATGDIDDLEQDADTYIIFNCGSSSDVI